MDFMLNIDLKKLDEPLKYGDKVMLAGSCFTEHIGNALGDLKFDVLQNPNGILFGPDSVCKSLLSYVENKQYLHDELFYLNEVWNSWNHHSRFSHIDKEKCLDGINTSQKKAHEFLKTADWLILTLGSSFIYRLNGLLAPIPSSGGGGAANCHRAPAAWFTKEMLEIDDIKYLLESSLKQLKEFNPIDHLDGLLANKVPMFIVHGDSDVVVPYDDNSALVKQRYEAGGGQITVKIIPGEGHKVSPSFFECRELVDFVLANARL